MRKKVKEVKKIILMILVVAIVISTNYLAERVFSIDNNEINEVIEQTSENEEPVDYSNVYEDGKIKIYNALQLKAIGTNQYVKNTDNISEEFGLGQTFQIHNQPVSYSLDADYLFMNDIELGQDIWQLPEGFIGTFTTNSTSKEKLVYKEDTDSIYIYHLYQIEIINQSQTDKEPVLTNDYDARLFGTGNFIYPTNSKDYLTYSHNHNYILSQYFTTETPTLYATEVQAEVTTQIDGRDYVGQVYKEIAGKKYILIGNEQQLRAIGSNQQVTPMLFLMTSFKLGIIPISNTIIPYYPGDADLNILNIDNTGISYNDIDEKNKEFKYLQTEKKNELMNADFSDTDGLLEGVLNIVGGLLGILSPTDSQLIGLNDTNLSELSIGKSNYKTSESLKSEYQDLKYSSDANYIVFRNIDLKSGEYSNQADDQWEPLMFSGNMIGAVASQDNSIWTSEGNIADNTTSPTISNIAVNQTQLGSNNSQEQKQLGIGFFGSITNKVNTSSIGTSAGLVSVKNINLEHVSITNKANKIEADVNGIIGALTGILGTLLGDLLGNLGKVLDNILNPTNTDNSSFATGGFAGRISGDVTVENCHVKDLTQLSNISDMTGGFVGNVEGVTEYKGLQEGLGNTVGLLTNILNIIPFLDLGTLIDVLLDGNIINIDQLVPTGYYNPVINDCSVQGESLNVESNDKNYIGGFAGRQVGTIIKNSTVQFNSLTLNGKNLIGGFAGLSSNAELVGLLDSLGVDLINAIQLNSYVMNCKVEVGTLNVKCLDKYSGGLIGALCNSYSIDNTINSSSINIKAHQYAGGITGYSSIAQSIALGNDFYTGNKDLITLLGTLLNQVLSDDEQNVLLSLTGINPSIIAGNEIKGELVVLSNDNYAGGFVGYSDGGIVLSSNLNQLQEHSFVLNKNKVINETLNRKNSISQLKSVSANNYSGGIAGKLVTASAAGLLNKTLGIGNYLGFHYEDISVTGINSGSEILATQDYAGGAFGQLVGGTVKNVVVTNMNSVKGQNYVGGFVGNAGTGSLASANGLNILGLIDIKNLLSIADAVETTISDSQVQGIDTQQ